MYRRRGSSHQFLQLAEEAGRLGFWSLDLVTGEMLGSPGLARIAGQSPNKDPSGILDDFVHPADRAAQADLRDHLRHGRGFRRTYRIVRADRTLRWIKVRADVILGSGAVPVRAEGIVFDVTETEQARCQAEESRARYEGLLEAIGAIVWTASPEGRHRPSAGWQTLTGQEPEDLHGEGWLMAIHERDRDAMARAWRKALSERASFEIEVGILCRGGQTRRFRSHGAPLRNEDGTVHEWIGVLVPIGRNQPETPLELDGEIEADGALVRAGRALLGWSMAELARAAGVSVASVTRLEDPDRTTTRPKIRRAILGALTQAGVAFDRDGEGALRLSLRPRAPANRPSVP